MKHKASFIVLLLSIVLMVVHEFADAHPGRTASDG